MTARTPRLSDAGQHRCGDCARLSYVFRSLSHVLSLGVALWGFFWLFPFMKSGKGWSAEGWASYWGILCGVGVSIALRVYLERRPWSQPSAAAGAIVLFVLLFVVSIAVAGCVLLGVYGMPLEALPVHLLFLSEVLAFASPPLLLVFWFNLLFAVPSLHRDMTLSAYVAGVWTLVGLGVTFWSDSMLLTWIGMAPVTAGLGFYLSIVWQLHAMEIEETLQQAWCRQQGHLD